ncbi:hypothetical protein [Nocardia sp. NPDC050435]|uniref:hypothetical protein n=1 Tax=Nocardia sp. NPDC050435 TaxID=3155040 RepID=UPI0033D02B77
MTVTVSAHLISSDLTSHYASYWGCGWWAASILPGRKVSAENAEFLIGAADELAILLDKIAPCAEEVGLTNRELLGLIARMDTDPNRPRADTKHSSRWWRRAA